MAKIKTFLIAHMLNEIVGAGKSELAPSILMVSKATFMLASCSEVTIPSSDQI